MYNKAANFILTRCLSSKDYLDEEEYEYAVYVVEIFLINVEKMLFVLGAAAILRTLPETLLMLLPYAFIRKHALGWHALSSKNCTLLSITIFVLLPLLVKQAVMETNIWLWLPWLGLVHFLNYHYAPADTEKNPLVNALERLKMRKSVLKKVVLLSIIIIIPLFQAVKPFLIMGMLAQSLMVSPLIYKITKRSYRNYENYEEI